MKLISKYVVAAIPIALLIAIACSASNDPEYCFEQVGGGSYYLCNKVGGAISSSVASVPPSTLQCIPYIAERLVTDHVRPDLFRGN